MTIQEKPPVEVFVTMSFVLRCCWWDRLHRYSNFHKSFCEIPIVFLTLLFQCKPDSVFIWIKITKLCPTIRNVYLCVKLWKYAAPNACIYLEDIIPINWFTFTLNAQCAASQWMISYGMPIYGFGAHTKWMWKFPMCTGTHVKIHVHSTPNGTNWQTFLSGLHSLNFLNEVLTHHDVYRLQALLEFALRHFNWITAYRKELIARRVRSQRTRCVCVLYNIHVITWKASCLSQYDTNVSPKYFRVP